jgi:hypothetical protein
MTLLMLASSADRPGTLNPPEHVDLRLRVGHGHGERGAAPGFGEDLVGVTGEAASGAGAGGSIPAAADCGARGAVSRWFSTGNERETALCRACSRSKDWSRDGAVPRVFSTGNDHQTVLRRACSR